MLPLRYRYKTDPIDEVRLMFGGDFRALHPNRETRITNVDTGETTIIPIDDDDVVCDSCNVEIDSLDPCALTPGRLYCWKCFNEWIRPHILDEGKDDPNHGKR